ncbi:MAG: aldose 1-epimerase family protein [Ruthenibacterium sp.]
MDFTIENDFLRVTVRSKGAEVVSVQNKQTGEEMMWSADPAVWGRTSPILFPYCGRLLEGKYTKDGTTYTGDGHGFARDLEHTLVDTADEKLTLCLEANALTMEKFPFAFKLFSTFWLTEKTLHHGIEVVNDGDEEMTFGFGYHPGFACPFDAQHTVQDYAVVFSEPETPEVIACSTETGLTTGQTAPYFENGRAIPLTDHLFDSDSICFSKLHSTTLSLVERGGRHIDVEIENFPYVLLWSAPGPLRFVCIEPWHTLPDAHDATGEWADKKPALALAPAARWSTQLRVSFQR